MSGIRDFLSAEHKFEGENLHVLSPATLKEVRKIILKASSKLEKIIVLLTFQKLFVSLNAFYFVQLLMNSQFGFPHFALRPPTFPFIISQLNQKKLHRITSDLIGNKREVVLPSYQNEKDLSNRFCEFFLSI
jgi:hypothetical protein